LFHFWDRVASTLNFTAADIVIQAACDEIICVCAIEAGLKDMQVTASSGECTTSKSFIGLWLLLKEAVLTRLDIMPDGLVITKPVELIMISTLLTCKT